MALSLVTLGPCFLHFVQTPLKKNAEFDGWRLKSILYFCTLI